VLESDIPIEVKVFYVHTLLGYRNARDMHERFYGYIEPNEFEETLCKNGNNLPSHIFNKTITLCPPLWKHLGPLSEEGSKNLGRLGYISNAVEGFPSLFPLPDLSRKYNDSSLSPLKCSVSCESKKDFLLHWRSVVRRMQNKF
jgi:hypothetical protein